MRIALFPGTFDPFTLGHASVVERGLCLFDKVVIAVGINDAKKTLFDPEERLAQIKACYERQPRVEAVVYQGLTVDAAKDCGASVLLRGVRSVMDFEYERQMADVNRKLAGLETVCLLTEPELACLQSSFVRDLWKHGRDVSAFLPSAVWQRINTK